MMRMRDLINTMVMEGKVNRHPLKSGGITLTVIDPTRDQFVSCLQQYDEQTARFVMDDRHLVIGDHYYWTHHDLQTESGIQSRASGWLAPWSVVVWGGTDINDFEHDEAVEGLIAANQPFYDEILNHPIFKRLYQTPQKIGFTCNDGYMITFFPDGKRELETPDVVMMN